MFDYFELDNFIVLQTLFYHWEKWLCYLEGEQHSGVFYNLKLPTTDINS